MANVVIRNKLRQTLEPTLMIGGKVVHVKVEGNQTSTAFPDTQLTEYTRRLATRGWIKITPV